MKTQINQILVVIFIGLFATMGANADSIEKITPVKQDAIPYYNSELPIESFINLNQSLDHKYSTELAGSWVDLGNPFVVD